MTDFINKLKKGVEDGYEAVRSNANNLKDIAEGFSKIAKLRFELYQLDSAREKKLTLLGNTVYPYLMENNVEALKTHETLQMLLDEIKNLSNQIELLQHAIEDIASREKVADKESIKKEIEKLEKEIEQRLNDIKAVKDALE